MRLTCTFLRFPVNCYSVLSISHIIIPVPGPISTKLIVFSDYVRSSILLSSFCAFFDFSPSVYPLLFFGQSTFSKFLNAVKSQTPTISPNIYDISGLVVKSPPLLNMVSLVL